MVWSLSRLVLCSSVSCALYSFPSVSLFKFWTFSRRFDLGISDISCVFCRVGFIEFCLSKYFVLSLHWDPLLLCSSQFVTCSLEASVSCQPCKYMRHCLQVFLGPWEVDDPMANGNHLLSGPVDNAVEWGIPNSLETILNDDPLANQNKNNGLNCGTSTMSVVLIQKIQQHRKGLSAQTKIWPCVRPSKNLCSTGTLRFTLQ